MHSTRLLFADDAPSPLGRLRMAGTIAGSTGIARRRLDSYAIVLSVAGGGSYSDELGASQEIRPGDLLILFPGLRHSYGPGPGQRWDEFYLVFDGPAFEFLEQIKVLDRNRSVVPVNPFEPKLSGLLELTDGPRPVDARGRAREVCSFIGLLIDMTLPGSSAQTWVDKAKARLSENLDREADVSTIASAVGMQHESFRKRFKAATGTTPIEFRNMKRLETARELLASTSLSIRQIAGNLGYYDEFHFSRRFREASGSAPGAYRRRVRGA